MRSLYIDHWDEIYPQHGGRLEEVTAFLRANAIQRVNLYNVGDILIGLDDSAGMNYALYRLREHGGVRHINAAYGSDPELTAIVNYRASAMPHKFDGVISELEWWVDPSEIGYTPWDDSRDLIERAKTELPGIEHWAYVGYPTEAQWDALVPLVEHLAVNAYVRNPEYAFNPVANSDPGIPARLTSIGRPGNTIESYSVIYSAERIWMGRWLQHASSLALAESIFRTTISIWEPPNAAPSVHPPPPLEGFTYFAYSQLRIALYLAARWKESWMPSGGVWSWWRRRYRPDGYHGSWCRAIRCPGRSRDLATACTRSGR